LLAVATSAAGGANPALEWVSPFQNLGTEVHTMQGLRVAANKVVLTCDGFAEVDKLCCHSRKHREGT